MGNFDTRFDAIPEYREDPAEMSAARAKMLPALRDALQRLAGRAEIDIDSQLDQVAQDLREGRHTTDPDAAGYDPLRDPAQWQGLAATENYRTPPDQIPDHVFGHQLRDANGNIDHDALERLRAEQWTGWSGPGWTQSEMDQHRELHGRDINPHEFAPGDFTHYQHVRDHDLIKGALEGKKPGDLMRALRYYDSSKGATHLVGEGNTPLEMIPGPTWGTSNFQSGADPVHAMTNPDWAFGAANTKFFSPMENAVNAQTTHNAHEKQVSEMYRAIMELPRNGAWWLATAPIQGAAFGANAAWDFAQNSLDPSTPNMLSRAAAMAQADDANKASPPVPLADQNSKDPFERADAINGWKQAAMETQSPSTQAYYRTQMSDPSAQVSDLGRVTSWTTSGAFDPTLALGAAIKGAVGTAKTANEYFKFALRYGLTADKASKYAARKAATAGVGLMGGEGVQEGLENAYWAPLSYFGGQQEDGMVDARSQRRREVATERVKDYNRLLPKSHLLHVK